MSLFLWALVAVIVIIIGGCAVAYGSSSSASVVLDRELELGSENTVAPRGSVKTTKETAQ